MNSTFTSKYKLVEKIGEGSFSDVLKCEDKQTGKCYAAKHLKKSFKHAQDVANCAEVIAMNKLAKHPNIVYMLEFHYDPSGGRVIFIFELMDMSMYDFMKLKKRRIPEPRVRSYLYQILKGLDHLHNNGLFHRDIKPENILVKLTNSFTNPPYNRQGEIVKLADFGSIRGIYSKQPYTEYISTRWYRSPECLLTVGYYGPKMDIWATGCVFYEMLTLKPLFPGQDEIDQLAKIHEIIGTPSDRILNKMKKKSRNCGNFPKQPGVGLKYVTTKVSDEAIVVLQLMLQYDPDLRINVRRLLDHRFFRTLREDDNIFKYKKMPPRECLHLSDITTNKSKGDSNRVPILCLPIDDSKNKFKTHSGSDDTIEKKKTRLHAKTTTDVVNYSKPHVKLNNHMLRPGPVPLGPLVSHKQMKSWGVDPDILKPKEDPKTKQTSSKIKPPVRLQRKEKHVPIQKQEFSKTTSYLPHVPQLQLGNTESSKYKYFMSKSFVIPARHTIGPVKVKPMEPNLNQLRKKEK